MLDDALWTPGWSGGIVAHDRETLGKIFNIIRLAFEHLPDGIKPLTDTETKNMFRFTHRFDGVRLDSEIYVALKIRGTTVMKLHVSEAAYNKDRGELKRGAKQAVPIGGKIVEESTGNGMEDWYDDVMEAWEKQKSGKATLMDYYVAFYSWVENPEYTLPGILLEKDEDELKIIETAKNQLGIIVRDGQLLWRRWKMNEMKQSADGVGLNTKQQFKQEYPLTLLEAFQSASGNVFDLERLEQMKATIPIDGVAAYKQTHTGDPLFSAQDIHYNNEIYRKFQQLNTLGVKSWHLPQKGLKYVLGCDPSDGTGGDDSCIDIWTRDKVDGKYLQCAQFYGQMRPDLLAQLIKYMAEMYNDAFAGVENNMLTTILFLKEIYDNYYMEVRIDQKLNKRTTKVGFSTNLSTRDPMIDEFRILWEEDVLEINSAITIKQMRTFVKKENGKREHAEGKSDDALFGAFIAQQMRKHEPPRGRMFTQKAAGF